MYKKCVRCQQYHQHTFDGRRWYPGKCPPKKGDKPKIIRPAK